MRIPIRLPCQIYLLLVLLAATTLSSLPYLPVALVLLSIMLFITLRPLRPRINIVITIAAIFLLPQILEPLTQYLTSMEQSPPLARQFMVVVATLPAIYILDYYLKQNVQKMTIVYNQKSKHTTTILNALFVTTLAILLVSPVINNPVLLFTAIAFVIYLLAILIRILYAIPKLPVDIAATRKRVIAGTTTEVSLHAINKASVRLHSLLNPVDPWIKTTPQKFILDSVKTQLNLIITPPLAGPSLPQLQASLIDFRGLVQVNQVIEPLELHVIPRARYAEWLAMGYLEQTGVMGAAGSSLLPRTNARPQKGIEYFDSRDYQPGDPLRDIDWKHTVKFNKLVIKEFIESGGQTAIVAVNLSVTDAEEADKLAFNLITTALTLAHEAIPTALTVYNHQHVTFTTPVTDPRETLKQTLLIVKDITSVKLVHRFLQPPDISALKRNITLLGQVTSEPVQRLFGMLQFEYAAIEQAAKNQPAYLALSRVTEHVQPPAIIALVSQMNDDTEALLAITENLTKRGFTTIRIEEGKLKLQSSHPNLTHNILAMTL